MLAMLAWTVGHLPSHGCPARQAVSGAATGPAGPSVPRLSPGAGTLATQSSLLGTLLLTESCPSCSSLSCPAWVPLCPSRCFCGRLSLQVWRGFLDFTFPDSLSRGSCEGQCLQVTLEQHGVMSPMPWCLAHLCQRCISMRCLATHPLPLLPPTSAPAPAVLSSCCLLVFQFGAHTLQARMAS